MFFYIFLGLVLDLLQLSFFQHVFAFIAAFCCILLAIRLLRGTVDNGN